MRILLDHGANINSLARNMTALYLAARDNFIEVVKTLLSYQPDLEIECDDTGYTALDVAVVEGDTEVVRLLLEAGADVNHKARFDTFPLQRAKEDTMKALLEYNPIMDLQDGYGDTALHKPSRDTSTPISIIKLLINGGANPEIRNKLGETALFTAVGNSNIEAVEYLISKRAERNISADILHPHHTFVSHGPEYDDNSPVETSDSEDEVDESESDRDSDTDSAVEDKSDEERDGDA
ncbi:ankyrin repeat-containing domain protein [Thermoascus aurantiacus ATCC 26904]